MFLKSSFGSKDGLCNFQDSLLKHFDEVDSLVIHLMEFALQLLGLEFIQVGFDDIMLQWFNKNILGCYELFCV